MERWTVNLPREESVHRWSMMAAWTELVGLNAEAISVPVCTHAHEHHQAGSHRDERMMKTTNAWFGATTVVNNDFAWSNRKQIIARSALDIDLDDGSRIKIIKLPTCEMILYYALWRHTTARGCPSQARVQGGELPPGAGGATIEDVEYNIYGVDKLRNVNSRLLITMRARVRVLVSAVSGRLWRKKIWMKFLKNILKFDKSGPLLATDQNYLLHSSLPLCSLLLTNCEGSLSVRLYNTYDRMQVRPHSMAACSYNSGTVSCIVASPQPVGVAYSSPLCPSLISFYSFVIPRSW